MIKKWSSLKIDDMPTFQEIYRRKIGETAKDILLLFKTQG